MSSILNWVNLEKISNKKNKINIEFLKKDKKKIPNVDFFLSIPFPNRIQKKIFHLFLSRNYRKIKSETRTFFWLKSIKKISSFSNFYQSFKLKKKKHKKIKSEILIIDKKLKDVLLNINKKIFKKILPNLIQVNLKNDISLEIIKNLAIKKSLDLNLFAFSIRLPKNNCMKGLKNNIINLIGGVFEKIPSEDNFVQKISLKTQILPKTHIYFVN